MLLKPQKEWVHMDKLEPEKLEWMRDLPAPRKKGTNKVMQYFLRHQQMTLFFLNSPLQA